MGRHKTSSSARSDSTGTNCAHDSGGGCSVVDACSPLSLSVSSTVSGGGDGSTWAIATSGTSMSVDIDSGPTSGVGEQPDALMPGTVVGNTDLAASTTRKILLHCAVTGG